MPRLTTRALRAVALGLGALVTAAPLAQAAPTPAAPTAGASSPAAPIPAPDPALREAVRRDLNLSWDAYVRRGRAAEGAARLDAELTGVPGYRGVSLDGEAVVVSGDGARVRDAAARAGARADGHRVERTGGDTVDRLRADAGDDVISVSATADAVVVRVVDPDRVRPGRTVSPAQAAAGLPGVRVVAARGPAQRRAIRDGEGLSTRGSTKPLLCSIGFAAFDRDGLPAVATAGHCSYDGANTQASLEANRSVSLGQLAFSQFGGPQNASNTQQTPGLDLSIYRGAPADLEGRTTAWNGTTAPVTGQTTAVTNAPVCMTGRTSRAWLCGRVIGTGVYNVGGYRGNDDVRWVAGFETDIITQGGDSGGPIVQGMKAVGTISAGYDAWQGLPATTVGAHIAEVGQRGYALEVWLNTPVAGAAAPGRVAGRVPVDDSLPAGTTVEVSRGGIVSQVTPGGDGGFVASLADGDEVTAVSGYSRSTTVPWRSAYGTSGESRHCGLRNAGCFEVYAAGSLYWSGSTAPSLARGAIRDAWGRLGWENGRLGYPTSGEACGLRDGGCFQSFEGGSLYWSPGTGVHPVWGAMAGPWGEQGWETGAMGYPVDDEACGQPAGGCRQNFQNGSVTWSPKAGAHFVRGRIAAAWQAQGAQGGWLGYPTTNEMCGLTGGGCWQRFEGGRIYWSPASEAHFVRGSIATAWDGTGFEHGWLGYPTSDEFCGLRDGGCGQRFEHGLVYWSPASGANPVHGAIGDRYAQLRWETSQLAYPTSGEFCGLGGGGCFQNFQGGAIYWSPATGPWAVWGAIREYWAANGWEAGRFGYPTGPENCAGGTCTQAFERGTITWSAAAGARG